MIIVCAGVVSAQQPTTATSEKQSVPVVTTEQQKALSEAIAVADKAKAELDAAQMRFALAQTKAQGLLYQIMALLKISPAEWKPVLSQTGELTFEQIKTPEPVKKE
ncbi:MAG TPA: hypothetical protein VGN95_01320 [Pyrinomonadaceae bacterium]|nr:hypothetical protein [Pyrinomonadaceae bacterium]